jgi:hypothetical protein
MSNRPGLLLSSIVAGSILTLASAPALASALTAAQDIAYSVLPADNNWGSPCSIDWTAHTALTNGACLYTLSLQQDDPTITSSDIRSWWGMYSPGSPNYYDAIASGNHFTEIVNVTDIQEGDLLAVKYQTSATSPFTGYIMLVEFAPVLEVGSSSRYVVGIIDSTQSPHGSTDSRWHADAGGVNDRGVGSGDIYLDAGSSGEIIGHAWSTGAGSYYGQSVRAIKAGRFVR